MVQHVETVHASLQANSLVQVEVTRYRHIYVGIVRRIIPEMPYVAEGAHRIRDEGRPAQVWDTGLEVGAVANVGLSSSDNIETGSNISCCGLPVKRGRGALPR